MNINPGELCKRIEIIQKINSGTDTDGYPIITETVFHSCRAKFSRTSGTEAIRANADFETLNVRFLIRHTKKAIDRKMIVRYDGVDYEISYINDYEDSHQYIEIWASEVTNG